jgi:Uma2 family endonuclease
MSPASRAYDRGEKAELYARAGIPAYWLIDPLGERIVFTELLLGTTGVYEQQRRDDNLLTVLRPWPVTLDLPEWTRFRDDLRGAARKGG